VALKPKTPVDVVVPLIESLDMVLVMSVEPGFSGQKYIVGSDGRVAAVAALAKEANPDLLIEVDGGIGVATAPLVCAAGADVLVCGSAVFGADDPAQAVRDVKAAGDAARTRALGER
jgi:ribulose-phosphate 3-epimerase